MDDSKLSDVVEAAILAKCGTIVSLTLVWKSVAEKLRAAGASDKSAVTLITHLQSPRNLESLLAGLAAEGRTADRFLAGLRTLVDESKFGISAWLESIEIVQSRLTKDGRGASPSSIVGYIQCSAEFGSGVGNTEELATLVLGMLEQYGFEGQEGCGTGVDG
ncbi:hypothetical protein VDG1235_4738 [Verrucomicrobiia bacterium DG1235]|nr:hypothetical protein VDG1235_4738 [Verrucomicrobiae bacterium DG1235]